MLKSKYKRPSEKYIDKYTLSKAFLEYVGRRLAKTGVRPTKTAVAKEIHISQTMVSQISAGTRALQYETIAQYAANIKKNVGKLFLELTQLSVEAEEAPPLESSATKKYELLDRTFNEIEHLRKYVWQKTILDKRQIESLYEKVVVRSYKLLKDSGLRVISTAIGFRLGSQWQFLVSDQSSDNKGLKATKVSLPVPSRFTSKLDTCLQQKDIALMDDIVITYPGVNSNNDEETAFWKELTHCEPSFSGRRLRVWIESIFDSTIDSNSNNNKNVYSIIMLFFFEYSFIPTEEFRRTIHLLTSILHQIRSRELHIWTRKVSQFCGISPCLSNSFIESLECITEEKKSPVLLEALQNFSKLLWREDSRISKIDAWSFDWNQGKFLRLFEKYYQKQMRNDKEGETQKIDEVKEDYKASPNSVWWPQYASWREMTGSILINRKPIICNTLMLKDYQLSQKTDNKEKMVLGLPFVIHRNIKEGVFYNGALYIWYESNYLGEVMELISSVANQFPNLEIHCPIRSKILLSPLQKQLHDISQQPTFLELEDSRCPKIWQCPSEIVCNDKFQTSQQFDNYQEKFMGTELC